MESTSTATLLSTWNRVFSTCCRQEREGTSMQLTFLQEFEKALQCQGDFPLSIPSDLLSDYKKVISFSKSVVVQTEIEIEAKRPPANCIVKFKPRSTMEERARIANEYVILKYLLHCSTAAPQRQVVQTLGWGHHNGDLAIVLELLEPCSLREPMHDMREEKLHTGYNATIPACNRIFYIIDWAAQLADCLSWVHDLSITHGDVKPDNFVFMERPSPTHYGKLLLIDFENSELWSSSKDGKSCCSSPGTSSFRLGATIHYASPEVLMSFQEYIQAVNSRSADYFLENDPMTNLLHHLSYELDEDAESYRSLGSPSHSSETDGFAMPFGTNDVWAFGLVLRELFDTTGELDLFNDMTDLDVVHRMNSETICVPAGLLDRLIADGSVHIFKEILSRENMSIREATIMVSLWYSRTAHVAFEIVTLIKTCLHIDAHQRPSMRHCATKLKKLQEELIDIASYIELFDLPKPLQE